MILHMPTIKKTESPAKKTVSINQFESNESALRLLELVKSKSAPFIFLTGGAGTGKSTLIKIIIETTKNVALTGTTGLSSLNIGGQTLNSLFRLGAKLMLKWDLDEHKCPNQSLFDQMEYLIIDEISMLRADMLDAVDFLLKKWRKRSEPFGGVIIIGSGDLLQLPPVIGKEEAEIYFRFYASPWFFYADAMADINAELVELTHVYRQTDAAFLDALNRIRENNNHRDAVALINRTCFRDIDPNFTPELILCSKNDIADAINRDRLNKVQSPLRIYKGEVKGYLRRDAKLPSPIELGLKVGCKVMITKNIENAVNGQLGTVVSLGDEIITVKLDSGNVIAVEKEEWKQTRYEFDKQNKQLTATESENSYTQFPLTLGYAISIHKSQGMTLDSVLIDLGNSVFTAGMVYTALSRCRSIEGIKLVRPISMKDVKTDQTILNFYRRIRKEAA